MSEWTSDELGRIEAAEELRTPVTVWVVRVGDDLYARSWRGSAGGWYRTARDSHEGRISAGGVDRDVAFVEETDPVINDQIDAAYREKYRRYASYVPPMISPEARATMLKLVPRST